MKLKIKRLGATCFDFVILFCLVNTFRNIYQSFIISEVTTVIFDIVCTLIFIFLFISKDIMFLGNSIGKRVFKVSIATKNNKTLTKRELIMRNFLSLCLFPCYIFTVLLYNQSVGDKKYHTFIVKHYSLTSRETNLIVKIKKYLKYLIVLFPVIFILLGCFTRMGIIFEHVGDYIASLESPTGEYTLNSYRYSGGATTDWSVRVEVVNNKTKKRINLYSRYHDETADMEWLDEQTVKINGIVLNIHKDYYNK